MKFLLSSFLLVLKLVANSAVAEEVLFDRSTLDTIVLTAIEALPHQADLAILTDQNWWHIAQDFGVSLNFLLGLRAANVLEGSIKDVHVCQLKSGFDKIIKKYSASNLDIEDSARISLESTFYSSDKIFSILNVDCSKSPAEKLQERFGDWRDWKKK